MIGRPNVGKSTVFNSLTKKNSRVSNYFQATVEKTEAKCGDYTLVDLPGIFDFSGTSADEKLTIKCLEEGDYEKIVYVLKADEYQYFLDIKERLLSYKKEVIVVVTHLLEYKDYLSFSLPAFLSKHRLKVIAYQSERDFKREFLTLLSNALSEPNSVHHEVITKKGSPYRPYMKVLDRLLLQPTSGLLLLFSFFCLLLFISFFLVSGATNAFLTPLQNALNNLILVPTSTSYYPFFEFLRLAIIPTFFLLIGLLVPLFVLYFLVGLMEDFGYLSRVELLLTPLARSFGLSGRSFISYILGTGCLVPAVLQTRSLQDEKVKKKTLFTLTYIPCGAKLPVIIFISRLCYPEHYFFLVISLYLLSMLITLFLAAILFNKKREKRETSQEIIPLPIYHKPRIKVAVRRAFFDLSAFSLRIVGPVLLMNVLIYFLSHYNFKGDFLSDTSGSILATISSYLLPVFRPIGLRSYEPLVALLFGLVAKEETLSALLVLSDNNILNLVFNPLQFLIFFTLYNPCFVAYSALYKEDKSRLRLFFFVILQFFLAYFIAFVFG